MGHNMALGIIDMGRGFMPAEEGERLGLPGFGELTVPDGHLIIPALNELTVAFDEQGEIVFTTGDSHKEGTAHVSEDPNFVDTWPAHCMEGTPGAELHPDLIAGQGIALHFIKGDVVAATPADDDSYTATLAHGPHGENGADIKVPDYLRAHDVTRVVLGGVALGDGDQHPLCVDSSARRFHDQGFEVTVLTDASREIVPENRELCFRNLEAMGVQLATVEEVAQELAA